MDKGAFFKLLRLYLQKIGRRNVVKLLISSAEEESRKEIHPMKILLTAFDPFDGESINPALESIQLLPGRIGNIEIIKLKVPTIFGKSIDIVNAAVEREQPDAVLCIGQAGGIPASVSNSAGTFVCNHLMYGLLHTLSCRYPHIRGGFMHVPYTPGQVVKLSSPAPCLSARDIATGIEAALMAIAENEQDITSVEGKIC